MKTPKKMTMAEIREGIRLAIEQSVADKYEAFVQHLREWWFRTATEFAEKNKGKTWYEATHGPRGEALMFWGSIASDLMNMVETVKAKRSDRGYDADVTVIGELKKNAEASALALAKDEADQARAHFINKNTLKLENIIHNKSLYGVEGLEVTPGTVRAGNTFEGTIELKFSDGMEFTVLNKLVYKLSTLGRPFYQYPTTFHNVKIPGQKTRAMIPEDEMLEVADPDNIGKRISKAEEIDKEEKQKRKDEREAKRDIKRQKALERYSYEVTMPNGQKEVSDPTNRPIQFAVAQRYVDDGGVGRTQNWVIYHTDWVTDKKKAEAKIRQVESYGQKHEFAILPARKIPHPEYVGEVGGEVDIDVMIEGSFQFRRGTYRIRSRDAKGNRFIWESPDQQTVGAAVHVEGRIEQHAENDKYEKFNVLGDVRVGG